MAARTPIRLPPQIPMFDGLPEGLGRVVEEPVRIPAPAGTVVAVSVSKLEHDDIDVPPNPSDDTESGWAGIASIIQDMDKQKIKDYKEDIDTVLLFAALYASVLSALLVESVRALQLDPNTVMVALLTQLVSQTHSYTLIAGSLNSTANPLDLHAITQFQPSLSAKRVNVLWFASLTLALVSASFGILVKQWLREYLASESTVPLVRLRVRHFRKPGMEDWHVFALAAMLPLMLQLSLALFFVGLCFFTLDIDDSIGFTTIPLVGGWALLFGTAFFAPLLSSRCPYKIALFKSLMQVIRHWVTRVLTRYPSSGQQGQDIDVKDNTYTSVAYDEEGAAKDARHDVGILVDVYKSQADDRLLMMMCSALKETHSSPDIVLEFVLKIINFRLGTNYHATGTLPSMLDLTQLPEQTCTILMDTVADILRRGIRRFPASQAIQYTGLMRDCRSLLVARLPCNLSDEALRVLANCFAGTHIDRTIRTVGGVIRNVDRNYSGDRCLHLQKRLRYAFNDYSPWQLLTTMATILIECCCDCPRGSYGACETIGMVLERHQTISNELKEHTCEVSTSYMLHQLTMKNRWTQWHRELLLHLCRQYRSTPDATWHDGFHGFLRNLLIDPIYAPNFFCHLYRAKDTHAECMEVFLAAFSGSTEQEQILVNLRSSFTGYLDEMYKAPSLLGDSFYVSILEFIAGQIAPMLGVIESCDKIIVAVRYVPLYRSLWLTAAMALSRRRVGTVLVRQTSLVRECLRGIDRLDDLLSSPTSSERGAYVKIFRRFNSELSFFADEVIEQLIQFLPYVENNGTAGGSNFKRVSRLLSHRWTSTDGQRYNVASPWPPRNTDLKETSSPIVAATHLPPQALYTQPAQTSSVPKSPLSNYLGDALPPGFIPYEFVTSMPQSTTLFDPPGVPSPTALKIYRPPTSIVPDMRLREMSFSASSGPVLGSTDPELVTRSHSHGTLYGPTGEERHLTTPGTRPRSAASSSARYSTYNGADAGVHHPTSQESTRSAASHLPSRTRTLSLNAGSMPALYSRPLSTASY